ncbi:Phosphatidylethanolamine-binding protein PEBP [Naviculisporaceae sp. PSN 640]
MLSIKNIRRQGPSSSEHHHLDHRLPTISEPGTTILPQNTEPIDKMPKEASSISSTLASLSPDSPAPLRINFPSTNITVSSPGVLLTKEAAAPTPVYSISARALCHLTFSNCDLSPTTSASTESSLSIPHVTSQPPPEEHQARRGSLRLETSTVHELVPKYMVITLDLDAPFPSVPLMSPLLHGIQADLTLATEDIDPDDEYIPLEATSPPAGIYGNVGKSGEVVDYMGPSPPPTSAPHRYMFMLWEQPGGLTGEKICEEIGIGKNQGSGELHGDMGMMGRARFDQEGFERRLGLKRVVGGNYFVCG